MRRAGLYSILAAVLLALGSCNSGRRTNFGNLPSVPRPDLIPSNLSISPTSMKSGTQVSVTFTVENMGNAPSGPFRYGFYASTDSTVDTNDALQFFINHPGLDPNKPATVTDKGTINGQPGQIHFAVIADDDKKVDEWLEGNNTSTPVTVTITP